MLLTNVLAVLKVLSFEQELTRNKVCSTKLQTTMIYIHASGVELTEAVSKSLATFERWIMQTSLLKTLAAKHKTSRMNMLRRYQATLRTPHGTMKCLEITVERGGEKKPLVA